MPIVKLRFDSKWFKVIESAANESGRNVDDFIMSLVAASCPLPTWEGANEAAVKSTVHLCAALERTKQELLTALSSLTPAPASQRNPRVAQRRRQTSAALSRAMERKGLRVRDIARHIGVAPQVVSHIRNGKKSLPPAWSRELEELLGENWMSE